MVALLCRTRAIRYVDRFCYVCISSGAWGGRFGADGGLKTETTELFTPAFFFDHPSTSTYRFRAGADRTTLTLAARLPALAELSETGVGNMALERILKRSRFAARLSVPHRSMLGAMGRRTEFKEDQLILQAGQRSTHFYLLVSGSVCVEVRTPVYTVCVQVLGPGDVFGWSSFLDHHDTLFQVRARESSRAIYWDAVPLFDACRKNPEFGLELYSSVLAVVAGRVKATESKLAEFCGSCR